MVYFFLLMFSGCSASTLTVDRFLLKVTTAAVGLGVRVAVGLGVRVAADI